MSKETVDSGVSRGGQSISHTLMKRIDDIQRNTEGFSIGERIYFSLMIQASFSLLGLSIWFQSMMAIDLPRGLLINGKKS